MQKSHIEEVYGQLIESRFLYKRSSAMSVPRERANASGFKSPGTIKKHKGIGGSPSKKALHNLIIDLSDYSSR